MNPLEPTPSDPQLIARVGHAYYDWASDLYTSGQKSAAAPVFERAVTYYDRFLASVPDDAIVLGDRAFALHYAGSSEAAAALERFILTMQGNADLAGQLEHATRLLNGN